jgi:hypothetical protein
MASTYSTNLKIELQATGENSGTWGTITNTNLGTALEQAIVGYGNPSFASDANLTLTYTDTNAAQAARALVLNVTSSVSLTATRELVVPTIQKQYIVQNNTTGSQSITVKTSGGTGITVPNGRKAHLYVDGTNVIQMFDFVDINGGAIDGTTVGAASASTGAFTTLTASGATTLNGAVALGDAAADLITVPGTVNSNVLFTDNSFDIGASGATRPRTGYFGTSVLSPLVTATNVQVTNVKANDGTAAVTITDSTGAVGVSTAFTLSTATGNIALGTSQTTGTLTAGGTAATGTITVDQSTKTHTLNVGSGATENAATKTVNIATGGVSGSTTTITIGSTNGTATTLNGTLTATDAVTFSATTQNISLGASQTTGTWTAGGTAATGAITLDASTKAHTLNIGSGATESGATKTINIGTEGVATSTTTMTIGSANGTTITMNGTVTAATLNSTTIDTTNLEVTNIKAKDGTAAIAIADSTGAVSISTNVTLGDASTDTVTVNGYMGVGGAASSNVGLFVRNSSLTTTAQSGVTSSITGTSSAVSIIRGFASAPSTEAASFTAASVAGFWALNASKGAGSTITDLHGIYIADQTQGTNNYGITSLVTSGTNKWNIYASGTAANYFAGNVGIGTTSPDYRLQVSGTSGQTFSIERVASSIGSSTSLGTIAGTGEIPTLTADGASIQFIGAGTWSATSAPGRIVFSTTPAATTTPVERFQLAAGEAVFNDPGNDYDFRVEGDTDANLLFADASTDRVGIGTSSPDAKLQVEGGANPYVVQNSGRAVYGIDIQATAGASGAFGGALSFGAGAVGRAAIAAVQGSSDADTVGLTFFIHNSGTSSADAVEAMRIDSAGNLGLGVTPSAWGSSSTAIQNRNASFWATSAAAYLGYNYFYDGSARKYIASSFATEYTQLNGQHLWYTAASGTAGNTITFTQAMTLDASGRLLVGATSALGTAQIQSASSSVDPFEGYRFANNANGPALSLYKNRGASVGSNAIVASGDELGTVAFRGYDGAAYRAGAFITGAVDGTPGSGDMPGRLVFSTTADGASSPTERMRLDSAGNLGLGVTPSAWTSFSVFQFGENGSLAANDFGTDNAQVILGNNLFYDGSYKYIATGDSATRYQQSAGSHIWYTALSGTAGNTISFTERANIGAAEMVVNDPGNDYDFRVESDTNTHALFVDAGNSYVGVNQSAPTSILHIYGAGGATGSLVTESSSTTAYVGNKLLNANGDSFWFAIDTSTGGAFNTGRAYAGAIWRNGANPISFVTNSVERLALTTTEAVFNESGADYDFRVESDTNTHALFVEATNSNVKIGGSAERATTVGTNHLDIFNGTAPVGTLANGISLYSSSGEAYVMDAAGNATLFSPHDAETNEWIFRSKHTPSGKVLRIDVERLLRFVNDHFGLDAVKEFVEE